MDTVNIPIKELSSLVASIAEEATRIVAQSKEAVKDNVLGEKQVLLMHSASAILDEKENLIAYLKIEVKNSPSMKKPEINVVSLSEDEYIDLNVKYKANGPKESK